MARQSAYLKSLQNKIDLECHRQRMFTIQWCADAAVIAANEVFRRRGDKILEFMEAFRKYSHEIADMTIADAKDDRSIEYTKAKVDARLKEILGDAFVPWEQRYGG